MKGPVKLFGRPVVMGKQQPKGSIEADSKKNSTTGRRVQGLKDQSELEEERGLEGDVEPLRGEEEKRRREERREGEEV